MSENRKEPAFVLNDGDRFHSIIASKPVRYEQIPDTETLIVFFVICRGAGDADIINVVKTFLGEACVSRNTQSKTGVHLNRINGEIEAIKKHFTDSIKSATGVEIKWNILDLSDETDRQEQVRRIQSWNYINVFKPFEFGLN